MKISEIFKKGTREEKKLLVGENEEGSQGEKWRELVIRRTDGKIESRRIVPVIKK